MLINESHAEFSLFFDAEPIRPSDTALLFQGNTVLLHGTALPLWKELAGTFASAAPLHAFSQGNRRFFVADAQGDAPPDYTFENIRVFRTLPPQDGALLNAAYHLMVWYREHRFCGVCGGPLHPAPYERALTCERCEHTTYPSIMPAIIVAITNGNRLLLARNAHSAWNHYSLIAGYMEVGETAEQAVQREVLEEVGLYIKNIRYIASQPWGLSQSLMLGFAAELDGSDEITLQESELSEAHWFARGEMPGNPSTASIAFMLMECFQRGELGGQE